MYVLRAQVLHCLAYHAPFRAAAVALLWPLAPGSYDLAATLPAVASYIDTARWCAFTQITQAETRGADDGCQTSSSIDSGFTLCHYISPQGAARVCVLYTQRAPVQSNPTTLALSVRPPALPAYAAVRCHLQHWLKTPGWSRRLGPATPSLAASSCLVGTMSNTHCRWRPAWLRLLGRWCDCVHVCLYETR
jgi:hypothetical protein